MPFANSPDWLRRHSEVGYDVHLHSGAMSGHHARFDIFEHQARGWFNAKPLGRQQKQVGRRLSDGHFVSGGNHVESVEEACRAKVGYGYFPPSRSCNGFWNTPRIEEVQKFIEALFFRQRPSAECRRLERLTSIPEGTSIGNSGPNSSITTRSASAILRPS